MRKRDRANFLETVPDEDRAEQLKHFKHHHSLKCGCVVRSDEAQCASNCLIDVMSRTTKASLPLACYDCNENADADIDNGLSRESAPGIMYFLLKNNQASLTDHSKCCGSLGTQYMLRNNKRRQQTRLDNMERQKTFVNDHGPPLKRSLPTSPTMISAKATAAPEIMSETQAPTSATLARSPAGLYPETQKKRKRTKKKATPSARKRQIWPEVTKKVVPGGCERLDTTSGQKRVRRSQHTWELHGELSNVNSLATDLNEL